jgi:hypothetical protein
LERVGSPLAESDWEPDILFFLSPNGHSIHTAKKSRRNLFARQSECHLIKLSKTIALHAYATII